jgi:tRNA(Ile)-lysidine synthase TilS/MesJ
MDVIISITYSKLNRTAVLFPLDMLVATKGITPPKALMRPIGRAIVQHQMIQEGDRVLLGLSGGKDSLALLMVLKHLQRHAPISFELAACTVDPEIPGFDPSPLKAYLTELGVPYFYESQGIMAQAESSMQGDSFCSFCSRMKRGILYSRARAEGYNVLALGQHLDDVAESLLMSLMYQGKLHTMKANYVIDAGDLRVIRPLIGVRERQTRAFAEAANLPVIADNCPACYSKPQQRERIKALLADEEAHNKQLFANLLSAMAPLIADKGAISHDSA